MLLGTFLLKKLGLDSKITPWELKNRIPCRKLRIQSYSQDCRSKSRPKYFKNHILISFVPRPFIFYWFIGLIAYIMLFDLVCICYTCVLHNVFYLLMFQKIYIRWIQNASKKEGRQCDANKPCSTSPRCVKTNVQKIIPKTNTPLARSPRRTQTRRAPETPP